MKQLCFIFIVEMLVDLFELIALKINFKFRFYNRFKFVLKDEKSNIVQMLFYPHPTILLVANAQIIQHVCRSAISFFNDKILNKRLAYLVFRHFAFCNTVQD